MKPDEIKEARHCDGEMVRWWDEEEYVGNKQNAIDNSMNVLRSLDGLIVVVVDSSF